MMALQTLQPLQTLQAIPNTTEFYRFTTGNTTDLTVRILSKKTVCACVCMALQENKRAS